MSNKKQYAIAFVIFLVGVWVSACILFAAFLPKGERNAEESTSHAETTAEAAEYTVTFHDPSGNVMQQSTLKSGDVVLPPRIHSQTQVFKGWNQKLFAVYSSINAYPIMADIAADVNSFYADTVYAYCNGDIDISVYIGGRVDCGDFVMEVYYDAKLMQFEGFSAEADGISATDDADAGCITLRRDGASVLSEPMTLCTLRFTASGEDSYETEILLRPKEIYTVTDGEKVYTDSVAYDATLHLLQSK